MRAIRTGLGLIMLVMFVTPSAADDCTDAVQGRIAWDYQGHTLWAASNLDRLCGGAGTVEPAMCFLRVMHGGVNYGGGVQWRWENAIDLCERSPDATWTVACFERQIAHGRSWQDAIRACDERHAPLELAGGAASSAGAVERSVLADGTVETRFPDGTIRRNFKGGTTTISPDGQETTFLFQSAQGATPPSVPPDTVHEEWLAGRNADLMAIISTLVGDDPASLANYEASQSEDLSAYQTMDRHIETIGLLVRP